MHQFTRLRYTCIIWIQCSGSSITCCEWSNSRVCSRLPHAMSPQPSPQCSSVSSPSISWTALTKTPLLVSIKVLQGYSTCIYLHDQPLVWTMVSGNVYWEARVEDLKIFPSYNDKTHLIIPSILVFSDVIGVCKEAMDMSSVTQRSTGRELKKREMQLLDNTNREVLNSDTHPGISKYRYWHSMN